MYEAMTPEARRWVDHPALGEPSLQRDFTTRAVRMFFGTSYAAPRVTHAAAVAQAALREALGQEPSANLIRATVGAAASIPDAPRGWYSDEDARCRMLGYGRPEIDRLPWSVENDSRLVAMDEVEENRFHLYRIPMPHDFLAVAGHRGITIALAYDPPIRGSRKEYMARTMFFEPLVALTVEETQAMLSRFDGGRDEEPRVPPGRNSR